jgi:hypothetical protein
VRGDVFLDQQSEAAVRQAGAASLDVTQLYESTRTASSTVEGAFTADTRAVRLAAVGMQSGDEWLEVDTNWLYYYTGTAWAYKTGVNTGTAAARGAITPAAADNGALFYETDTLQLWEVQAGAWVKLLEIKGTANQVTATIAAGVLTLSLPAAVTVATEYRVGGTKVVGAQGAAVADAAGGATVDTEARAALNALLARLRTHGLLAT